MLHENDSDARRVSRRRLRGDARRRGRRARDPVRRSRRPTTYREQVAERDHVAVRASLEPFFQPRSVAVVGASKRRGSIGGELFRNILAGDFAGSVYPVNRKGDSVAGVHGYTRESAEIAEGVDLAVICVPGRAGARRGGGGARGRRPRARRLLASGFAETGSEGTERQERLLALVREHGAASSARTASASPPRRFTSTRPSRRAASRPARSASPRRAARSGSRCSSGRKRRGLGVTSFVSIGNKADVSSNDLLEWWEDDEETEMVVLYLESFGNPRAFSRIARRARAPQADPGAEGRYAPRAGSRAPARTRPRSPARTSPSTRSSPRQA